jgi:cyclophilin family peptidyl-prolyl cis-trans isomerase
MNAVCLARHGFSLSRAISTGTATLLVACGGGGGGDAGTPPPSPTVTNLTLSSSAPKYSDELLITVDGSNLDQGLVLSAVGCKNFIRSTQAPRASTASTAYYSCTVSALGVNRVDAAASAGGAPLRSADYTVASPQVTLSLSNGVGGSVNGDVVVALDPVNAPITVDNFLGYVKAGFYAGTIFHRVVPGFVVVGGGYLPLGGSSVPVAKTTRPPIMLEVSAQLTNAQWTIAMERSAQADSATSQFFFNLVDNPSLDASATNAGYAVYGNIVSGAAVIQALAGVTCAAPIANFSSCPPNPDVLITSATQTQ